jgi:hypothetical protein
MLNLQEIRALGDALNTTWGKSSSDKKLTSKLAGDVLELQYMSIVQFAGERALSLQVDTHRQNANDIFKEGLKRIKEEFKDQAGRALKTKETNRTDNIELVSATSNSPRKIAYFRMNVSFQVS